MFEKQPGGLLGRAGIGGGSGWAEVRVGVWVKGWDLIPIDWGGGGGSSLWDTCHSVHVEGQWESVHIAQPFREGLCPGPHTLGHTSGHLYSGQYGFDPGLYLLPATMIVKLPLTLKTHLHLLPR